MYSVHPIENDGPDQQSVEIYQNYTHTHSLVYWKTDKAFKLYPVLGNNLGKPERFTNKKELKEYLYRMFDSTVWDEVELIYF